MASCRGCSTTVVGVFFFGIFQLDDVAVLHILVDFGERKQEDVCIACLCVLFRNRMVEAVLRRHGESEAVHVGFALLLVALGGVAVQAVVQLFTHYLVGDGQFGCAFERAVNGEHAEMKQQTDEIVRMGNLLGWESRFQFSCHESLFHRFLYDRSVVGKLLVFADKHT